MPYFDAGSIVVPIEALIENPEVLGTYLLGSRGCRCSIVDSPFVASVMRGGLRLDYTVGVGSLVCGAGCGGGDEALVLAEPAWGSGRIIEGGECVFYGSCGELEAGLAALGFRLRRVKGLQLFIDEVTKAGARGVAVLDDADPLSVEPAGGLCGVLRSRNPLHPAGVVGKPGLSGCIERLYRVVGPQRRLLAPILGLGDETVVAEVKGLGEGLLVGYEPSSASKHLRLAAMLGAVYECSRPGG